MTRDTPWRARATIPTGALYDWASQACQYPEVGDPGLHYFAGEVGGGKPPVDCLLWYDDDERLAGILNHYGVDYPPHERAGNVNIFIRPDAKRQGLGTTLFTAALERWEIDLSAQRFTLEGAYFANAWIKEHR